MAYNLFSWKTCLTILLSILIYPFLKLKGQLIAAKLAKIKIERIEIGRGKKKKYYQFKQACGSFNFPILMKAEAYPDYNTLENDKNQNWKLAFFYFAGPLFYTLIMAIIFLGAIGTFYLPYKFSGNPEYWDNLFSVYATPILLSLIVGWFICIWSSLFPLPWRRNSGFKTIVCLKRGFAKKPITSFPCVERVSEDRIWGESYIGEVVRDTGIEALKIICFILKWTVFLGITAIITGIHLGLHSDD